MNTANASSRLDTAEAASGRIRGCLELPSGATLTGGSEVSFSGWAFGVDVAVTGVEVLHGDALLCQLEVGRPRADVASAFPAQPDADRSGFHGLVDLEKVSDGDLAVEVVLSDGSRSALATLRLARSSGAGVVDPMSLPASPVGEYDLTSAEALRRLRLSPAMRWAKRQHDIPPPGTAWQRISDNVFFEPVIRPEFTVGRDDRVFALGSCFARNVEGALEALGIEVSSRAPFFEDIPFKVVARPWDFTNKYNTEAIRNELRWAFGEGPAFCAEALLRLPDETWEDPYASPVFENTDEATTLERHRRLSELTRRVSEARIVVITLGLIEAFLDTKTGLYTNTTPHLTAEPERFRFRVLSFEQVMEGLEDIHYLLTRHGHRDVEIVVTVSPVALDATFTGQDVVVANTLSKATLRAAAGAWALRHENVHYFPSYEIVMNSDRSTVWERDGRHVRPAFVAHVMDLFVRTHIQTDAVDAPDLAGARA